MIAPDEARELALGRPDAIEADHHGRPSFRVDGRIFATLWDAEHMNVMLDHDGILTAVAAYPEACAELWWGKRLAAVSVALREVSREQLAELLADAWERRATRRGGRG